MDSKREASPIVERPTNIVSGRKQPARSGSGSAVPAYQLDATTQHLLEENEGMLYEINMLRQELQTALDSNKELKERLADKEKDLELMREKLGDANCNARDASGRVINYKLECERLTTENTRLADEYKKLSAEIDRETDKIRTDPDSRRCDSARGLAAAQVEQFQKEMISFFPTVDRVIQALKRSFVVASTSRERVLENAQKELHTLQRVADTVRRMSVGDESRVNDILSRARKSECMSSPGELAILVRWMIVQAFESGLAATEGNLRAIEGLSSEGGVAGADEGGDCSTERSGKGSAHGVIRRPRK